MNFLATIWPLIEILRSLVACVNQRNKDYLRKTPCDWLCGDDAVFVKILRPLVAFWCGALDIKLSSTEFF